MIAKTINLDAIRINGNTQSRVEINNEIVTEYAYQIKDGSEFPPIVVFNDGVDLWLADGFHRWHAHKQAGKASIAADVRAGTLRDAILFSFSANSNHGMRRSNEDKRKAVMAMLSDSEWATWSDRKIAEVCGVGHPFVAAIRKPEVAEKQQKNRAASAKKKVGVESDSTIGKDDSKQTEAKPEPKEYAPDGEPVHEFTELDAAHEQIAELQSMLAVSNLGDVSAEEKTQAANLIAELRNENDLLRKDLEAVTRSRDQFQNEAAEAKKLCKSLQNQIKRLKA